MEWDVWMRVCLEEWGVSLSMRAEVGVLEQMGVES